MENIKAVLFDFDDTIGNRNEYAYLFYEWFLSENIKGFNDDPILKEAVLQDIMTWDQHSYVNKKFILEKLYEVYKYDLRDIDISDIYEDNVHRFVKLSDEVKEVLNTIKSKYRLGMITNGTSHGQRKKISQDLDLSMFETIIISGDYGYNKPDIRLFEKAISDLNLKPEEIAFVGDSFSRDINGSYRAGMKPIWIWPEDGRIQKSDVIRIRSIKELPAVLGL